MATPRICSIDGCGKSEDSRGWCSGHYARWRRHGDPSKGGRINPKAAAGEALRYYREIVLTYEGNECLTWPFAKSVDGYGLLSGHDRRIVVSRLVCERVHGPAPTPQHQASHSCGKGHEACVTKRHLSWKTRSGNQMDRVTHGTSNRGSRQNRVKVTEAEVRQIRSLRGIILQREIADLFGISRAQTSRIQRGIDWGWLD